MKLLNNITLAWLFYRALPQLNKEKKDIYKYRESGDFEKEREHILKATSDWGKKVVKDFELDLEIVGYKNLPDKGPLLYVGNHQGYSDIPICCAVLDKVPCGYVAKKELAKTPFYGEWIENIRSITLDRGNPREAIKSMSVASDFIKDGFSMLIYPEGTRSKSSKIGEFKKGSLKLATKAGIPIVPFTISGSYKIIEEKGEFQKGQKVKFTIHKPIETKDLSKEELNQLSDKVYEIVKSGL